MAIQSYVGSFTAPGAGVLTPQVVSGIVDANGSAFDPTVVIFFSSYTGFFDSAVQLGHYLVGFDDGTTAVCQMFNTRWAFGVDWPADGRSTTASFGTTLGIFVPRFTTLGRITAKTTGQFTYTLTFNEFGGDVFGFMALGGPDLEVFIGSHDFGTSSGSKSVSGAGFQPTGGVFVAGVENGGAFGSLGHVPSLGFVDSDLNQVGVGVNMHDNPAPVPAYRYQRTNEVGVGVFANAPQVLNTLVLSSWDADGFTVNYNYEGVGTTETKWGYLLFSGVPCSVGSVTQPASDGPFVLNIPGLVPSAILMASNNHAASTTIEDDAIISVGVSDGTRNQGTWLGVVNGATDAGGGGQFWGDDTAAIMLATPDAASVNSSDSTVNGTLAITGFAGDAVTGTWANCDGTQRQVLYLVFGGIAPTPTTTSRIRRRVRIFPLPVSESNKRMVLHSLEFLLQVGMGKTTGQGVDPQIMVQVSRDYGKTWSPERWVSAGKKGEFDRRVILRQLGQFRAGGYVKLAVTDPVQWAFLQAIGDLREGTS